MEEFKKLTDREHMLTRPSMYIGKTVPETVVRFIHGTQQEITVTPGLLKIVNELIDNSIDEYIRSNGNYATKIKIDCQRNEISVCDNGRGIPVEKYRNEWRPQVAWTEAKAGTSFSANRIGPGANGVGSVVANVFSKTFTGITKDGKHICIVECTNNMQRIRTQVKTATTRGTIVTIVPDFMRFGVSVFTDDHIKVIKDRAHLLAATYPNIEFTFNGEKIKYKNQVKYFEQYGDVFVTFSGEKFIAAVYPSDVEEYVQRSAIDGLDMVLGGTHEQIVTRELCAELRELIKKKYKLELMPAEIKRGIKLVFIGNSFPNMEFDSQTKERLTNSERVTKEWLGDIDYSKLAKKLMNVDSFINPIIQAKLAKQLAAEQRAVTLALKKQAKKQVDKHLEAKSKNPDDKILFLCEGDSAAGNGIKVRDPKKHGFFPLRGMPMNTFGAKQKDILDNKELSNIMAILGLRFGMSANELKNEIQYGRIGLLADADVDGAGGIIPMLLNFFYLWPDLFAQNRIYIIPSPRYVLTKGKGASRKVRYFYDTETYEKEKNKYKGYEIRYIKGLATLRDYEYEEVISNESNWVHVTIDDPSAFRIMYSENVTERKKLMSA